MYSLQPVNRSEPNPKRRAHRVVRRLGGRWYDMILGNRPGNSDNK
jgi:hypothetical protein